MTGPQVDGAPVDPIANAIAFLTSAARDAAGAHIEGKAKMRGRAIGTPEVEEMGQAAAVIEQAAVLAGSLFKSLDRIARSAEALTTVLSPDTILPEADPDLTGMRAALIAAAEQFEMYERHHRDKGTPESIDKAEVNRKMAARMRSAALLGGEAGAAMLKESDLGAYRPGLSR